MQASVATSLQEANEKTAAVCLTLKIDPKDARLVTTTGGVCGCGMWGACLGEGCLSVRSPHTPSHVRTRANAPATGLNKIVCDAEGVSAEEQRVSDLENKLRALQGRYVLVTFALFLIPFALTTLHTSTK